MALRKDNVPIFIKNKDFARKIAKKGGFFLADARLFLDALESVMIEELMAGHRVLIKGVGSWEIIKNEDREVHDPRNGTPLGKQDIYRVLGRGSVRLARYYKIKKEKEKLLNKT